MAECRRLCELNWFAAGFAKAAAVPVEEDRPRGAVGEVDLEVARTVAGAREPVGRLLRGRLAQDRGCPVLSADSWTQVGEHHDRC
jgi:hypothetical protein